ncbi:UNKNOWN [Stylonychia lemnae]|uniref:Uncharacterized protein n=1 Tax=Stylonychia lemnae TaxID=5949 RepID=A0A078AWR9_STYLE|nr:UNKNOWN [Stylonychia lemnae]|eukprot:CDW85258.1 UNKNOWN [Stylonychia lemnae]
MEITVQKDTPIEVTDSQFEKKLNYDSIKRQLCSQQLKQREVISLAQEKFHEIEQKVQQDQQDEKDEQKDCKIQLFRNLFSSMDNSMNTKNILRGKFNLKINRRLNQQQLIEDFAQEPIIFHLHKNGKFIQKLERELAPKQQQDPDTTEIRVEKIKKKIEDEKQRKKQVLLEQQQLQQQIMQNLHHFHGNSRQQQILQQQMFMTMNSNNNNTKSQGQFFTSRKKTQSKTFNRKPLYPATQLFKFSNFNTVQQSRQQSRMQSRERSPIQSPEINFYSHRATNIRYQNDETEADSKLHPDAVPLRSSYQDQLEKIIKKCNQNTDRGESPCDPLGNNIDKNASTKHIIHKVDSEIEVLRKRAEEINWLVQVNKELRVFRPQVIKTMFAMKEDDLIQKEEDIDMVRREHIEQKMNPNRYAAQLEKISRSKHSKKKF